MTVKKPPHHSRKLRKIYSIDQCALYKAGSKARLAKILGVPLDWLIKLACSDRNYRVFTLPAEVCPFTGHTRKARGVQEPKSGLRTIHERLLRLLRPVELPDYAHAAVKGRSYRSNANVHKGSEQLATFDIRKFYPSTSSSRVYSFFKDKMLCAHDVAKLLTALTCYNHGLPTGSPLSPLLSLHVNLPLFNELDKTANANALLFTCYVDDLTFSGQKLPEGFSRAVEEVVNKHGHRISDEKTRIYRHRQARHVTGIVIFDGKIHVPNARFHKARVIEEMLRTETDPVHRLELGQKLSGLLGEAAFIDGRFQKWAKGSYVVLRQLQAALKSQAQTRADMPNCIDDDVPNDEAVQGRNVPAEQSAH